MGRKGESLGRGVKYVGKGVRSKGGERAKEGTRGRRRKMERGRVWGEYVGKGVKERKVGCLEGKVEREG